MFSYSSTNFRVAYNAANYFDIYHLLNASNGLILLNGEKLIE
jgi:hypothetical protein